MRRRTLVKSLTRTSLLKRSPQTETRPRISDLNLGTSEVKGTESKPSTFRCRSRLSLDLATLRKKPEPPSQRLFDLWAEITAVVQGSQHGCHRQWTTEKALTLQTLATQYAEAVLNMQDSTQAGLLNSALMLSVKQREWERERARLLKAIGALQRQESTQELQAQVSALESDKAQLTERIREAVDSHKQHVKRETWRQYEVSDLKLKLSDVRAECDQLKATIAQKDQELWLVNCQLERERESNQRTVNRLLMLAEDYEGIHRKCEALEEVLKASQELFNRAEANANEPFYSEAGFNFVIPLKYELLKFLQKAGGKRTQQMFNIFVPYKPLTTADLATLRTLRYPTPPPTDYLVPSTSSFMPPFDNWMQIYMRTIYDSKFNEHRVCRPWRRPSSFVAFVCDWLQTFYIDSTTFQIHRRSHGGTFFLTHFLTYLAVARQDCWEVHVFREFLEDQLKLDELEFFLHARHLLVPRHEYEAMQPVKLASFDALLKILFRGMPSDELAQVQELLSARQRGDGYIDCAVGLRILVEVYRHEKVLKFNYLQEFFKKCGRVEFPEFREAVQSLWAATSEAEVVELYKECWREAKSHIDAETFVTVANERGWFFQQLLLRGNAPLHDEEVFAHWDACAPRRTIARFQVCALGLPGYLELLDKFEHLLNPATFKKPQELGTWTLSEVWTRYDSLCQWLGILHQENIKNKAR